MFKLLTLLLLKSLLLLFPLLIILLLILPLLTFLLLIYLSHFCYQYSCCFHSYYWYSYCWHSCNWYSCCWYFLWQMRHAITSFLEVLLYWIFPLIIGRSIIETFCYKTWNIAITLVFFIRNFIVSKFMEILTIQCEKCYWNFELLGSSLGTFACKSIMK